MADNDYLLALELQREFNREMDEDDDEVKEVLFTNSRFEDIKIAPNFKRQRPESNGDDLDKTCNLVHPQWETLDPAPDVHALFVAFDNKFFQSRLKCVVLEWSKRMYSCAGICYSQRNHFGMSITIRLSEPLLKLRTRKDLVETLLHEMIHAYCSVLGIREGNGGHGPNFKKIMYNINQIAGTNITVYHTFHDEVDVYKTHWWRCNGICQNRTPFLGYVKRTSNRAPGPNDFWWTQHLASCGGTFMKIREPEKRPKGKRASNNKENNHKPTFNSNDKGNTKDLRNFFTPHNSIDSGKKKPSNGSDYKGPMKTNGGGTILINPRTKPSTSTISKPTSLITSTPTKSTNNGVDNKLHNVFGFKDLEPSNTQPKTSGFSGKVSDGNLRNVVGFKDIGNPSSGETNQNSSMVGQGYTLSNSNQNNNSVSVDIEKLRNIWANKFPSNSLPTQNVVVEDVNNDDSENGNRKRRRLSRESDQFSFVADESINSKPNNTKWDQIDDDVAIFVNNDVIDLSTSDEELNEVYNEVEVNNKWSQVAEVSSEERHKQIKQEILDEAMNDLNENDIFLIDDDYDDFLENSGTELADTSLVNDLFGDDTLMKDFHENNAVVASDSKYHKDAQNDIITCPICHEKLSRKYLSEHLNGCVGITQKINPKKSNNSQKINRPPIKAKSLSYAEKLLKAAGYTNTDLEGIIEADEDEVLSNNVANSNEMSSSQNVNYSCPVCAQSVEASQINHHLDICLS